MSCTARADSATSRPGVSVPQDRHAGCARHRSRRAPPAFAHAARIGFPQLSAERTGPCSIRTPGVSSGALRQAAAVACSASSRVSPPPLTSTNASPTPTKRIAWSPQKRHVNPTDGRRGPLPRHHRQSVRSTTMKALLMAAPALCGLRNRCGCARNDQRRPSARPAVRVALPLPRVRLTAACGTARPRPATLRWPAAW